MQFNITIIVHNGLRIYDVMRSEIVYYKEKAIIHFCITAFSFFKLALNYFRLHSLRFLENV